MKTTKNTVPPKKEVSTIAPQAIEQRMKPVLQAAAHMDEKGRQEFVRDQAEQIFIQAYGSDTALILEVNEAKRQTDDGLKNLKAAEKDQQDCSQFVASLPEEADEGGYEHKSFWQWRPQDIALIVTLAPFTLVMLATSAINVYVNIMASGSSAFLDAEWKAVLISLIAPAGAIVFKMLPMVFSRVRDQERAKRFLIATSIAFIIYWAWSFNLRFEGVGAKPDITKLLVSDSASSTQDNFVFIQIFAEMMIAASIFTWIQIIFDRYVPFTLIPNPSASLVLERYDQTKDRHEKCLALYQKAEAQLSVYLASKQSFINDQLAALAMVVARNQSLFS